MIVPKGVKVGYRRGLLRLSLGRAFFVLSGVSTTVALSWLGRVVPLHFGEFMSMAKADLAPLVGVIMGSKSDSETLRHADELLTQFGVSHECRVVSAHRTPEFMAEYAKTAEHRGIQVIIAGAGGAAHLPGMVASYTLLPVIGVPVQSQALQGLDSLLSIVQMPGGVPVGTMAIGKAGAINAALLAVRILATTRPELREKLRAFQNEQTEKVMQETLP